MKPKPILLIPTARIPQVTYLRDRPRPIAPALPAGHMAEVHAVAFDRNRVATVRQRSTSGQILAVFCEESRRGTKRRVLVP